MPELDLNLGHDWAVVEVCHTHEVRGDHITLTFDGRDGMRVIKILSKSDALALADLLKTTANTIED